MSAENTAFLGLGSNQDNPVCQLKTAIKYLNQQPKIQTIASAPFYKTPAWGITEQPDFINSVVKITTSLSPHQLLTTIKKIEYEKMGRIKTHRWHQRIIDIDILLYNDLSIQSKNLTIPHPLIAQRWFVILPLLDLNPPLPIELAQSIDTFKKTNPKPEKIQKLLPCH